ncbi:uncharacterized protein PG986_005651 [Apiospora aurea]|uniref:Major facilitator superfamily (MFS) profile domain-containing protein n=1 Tax=Apiospora aurea TaxID=335848 RepID=A0ABR1QIJ7_9PEZI
MQIPPAPAAKPTAATAIPASSPSASAGDIGAGVSSSTVTTTDKVSKVRGVTVIATLAGISFLNTMGSAILVSAIPQIARDVNLQRGLELWPAAVYALAAGCLLLIFGALADSVVGAKPMWVAGSYLFCAFTVALGFAQTGPQSIAMCLPTAVGLITLTFPQRGTWRNVAFAMNGMGQPLGFALGLVLGGIFTDTIGWRWAYYMMAGINFVLSTASIWSLPHKPVRTGKKLATRLAEIDWVGAVMLSAALGLLMYVLAMTTSSYLSIGYAKNAALLAVSLFLSTPILKVARRDHFLFPSSIAHRRPQRVEGPDKMEGAKPVPVALLGDTNLSGTTVDHLAQAIANSQSAQHERAAQQVDDRHLALANEIDELQQRVDRGFEATIARPRGGETEEIISRFHQRNLHIVHRSAIRPELLGAIPARKAGRRPCHSD